MTFGESIQTVFRKYADFNGVASRAEFWWWTLFAVLVSAAFGVLSEISVSDQESLGGLLNGLWALAIFLPSLAVTVRRLRDAGQHWGNAFWGLIPVAGIFILAVFCAQPSRR